MILIYNDIFTVRLHKDTFQTVKWMVLIHFVRFLCIYFNCVAYHWFRNIIRCIKSFYLTVVSLLTVIKIRDEKM